MGLLMSMSFAGSIVMTVYFLFQKSFQRYFNSRWRYRILIMALFFFLVPFQIVKNFYIEKFNVFGAKTHESKILDLSRNVIQVTPQGNIYIPIFSLQTGILMIWGIIALSIILLGVVKYFKQKKQIVDLSDCIQDNDLLYSIETIKKRLGIKRKIRYRISCKIDEPLTIGIFRPILLLPLSQNSEEENNFIIEHELFHIKNFDTLIKLSGLLAIGLNWYNPLSYYLLHELNIVNENACDERVILNANKEEKMRYANLILGMITEKKASRTIYAASFNNKKRVEERILMIMNAKKQKTYLNILAGCLMLMLAFSSSLTVFAYDNPTIIMVKDIDHIAKTKIGEQRNTVFVEENVSEEDMENNKSFMSQFTLPAVTEIPKDAYFQDEMGNIYEIEYQNLEKECAHTYINGSFSDHVRTGYGCTLTLYKAQKCTKCGYLLNGEFETSSKYATCPH